MNILDLPTEIQFIVIHYIEQGNYLNLASLAQSCLYYKRLLSYKINWSDKIELRQSKENKKDSLNHLIYSINQQKHINYKSIVSEVSDVSLLQLTSNILRKSTKNLQEIEIHSSSQLHARLYRTLSCLHTQLTRLSIYDLDYGSELILTHAQACQLPLFWSQSTLETLDISTFPSHELCAHNWKFPKVKTLTISLSNEINWLDFKSVFPNLVKMTVIIKHIDQLVFTRTLLSNPVFFPWFKKLYIVSHIPLKQHINKQELKSSLLTLVGLHRIIAGWYIIKLS